MFKEIGKPVALNEFLPRAEMTPEKVKEFGAIAEKYGQQLFPPDYFNK